MHGTKSLKLINVKQASIIYEYKTVTSVDFSFLML